MKLIKIPPIWRQSNYHPTRHFHRADLVETNGKIRAPWIPGKIGRFASATNAVETGEFECSVVTGATIFFAAFIEVAANAFQKHYLVTGRGVTSWVQ